MAVFNAETVLFRPLGRWGSAASMVEIRGGCEGSVRGEGYEEDSERR